MGTRTKISSSQCKYLTSIIDCRLCISPWSFISSDDKLFYKESNCYNTDPHRHWAFKKLKFPSVKYLKGKTLLLSHRRNYWHKIIDEISLINLLCDNDINLNIFDNVICEHPITNAENEIHRIWSINNNKIVSFEDFKHFQCEELFFQTGSFSLSKEAITKTRSKIINLFKMKSDEKRKRIIIGRDDVNTRRWLNQNELIQQLEDHFGFKYVSTSDLNLLEQAYLFWNAELVVGVHGAALTNILFMQKNSNVIELRYFKQGGEFSSANCYLDLCNLIGLKHHLLLCDGNERNELKGRAVEDADIIVDPNKLIKLLNNLQN